MCWHGLLAEACGGRFCGESSVISTERSEWKSVTTKRLILSGLRKAPAANGEQEVLCKLPTIKELRDCERDE